MLREDIAVSLALGIDYAALRGPGTGSDPTGVKATSGIGAVAAGTNGAAPTWADIVNLEAEVGVDNGLMGSLAYLTSSKGMSKMKQIEAATNTAVFLWANGSIPGQGMVNGYPAHTSNQIPTNITKASSTATLTELYFGNWADIIIAQWGGLKLQVNPYILDKEGLIRIVGQIFVDVGIRHAESFALMPDLDPA